MMGTVTHATDAIVAAAPTLNTLLLVVLAIIAGYNRRTVKTVQGTVEQTQVVANDIHGASSNLAAAVSNAASAAASAAQTAAKVAEVTHHVTEDNRQRIDTLEKNGK